MLLLKVICLGWRDALMVRALGVLVEAWGSVPSTHIVLFSAPCQAQKDPVSLTSVGTCIHARAHTQLKQ